MKRIFTIICVLTILVSSGNTQIKAFTDYVFEDHVVYTNLDNDTVGRLRQLDIEFPTDMKDKNVLAKIQEQLIDTILYEHYHTTQLDRAFAKHWNINANLIKRKQSYPKDVPGDSDEYFDYAGIYNVHFDHHCGRTTYNKNGLYIMRYHTAWYDSGCHHYPDTRYIAFDTRTGEFVHFMDIFSEEYVDHEKKMVFDIYYYVCMGLLNKYPKISLQYWYNASFTLTSTSLILHYTHFTLGCWADGEQEIEIPADTAKLFLNPKWKHLFP